METGFRLFLAALQLSSVLGLAACGRQASRPTPENSANSIVAQATADNNQVNNGTINNYKETIRLKRIPTNSLRLPPSSLERAAH